MILCTISIILYAAIVICSDEITYIPHIGNKYEISDRTQYDHSITEEIDFNVLKADKDGNYLNYLFSMEKSVFIRTSNMRWIQNFYLPNLDCYDSKEAMILFQSEANSHSYIHFNNDTFKLEPNSNILFKSIYGKWNAIKIPYIRGKYTFMTLLMYYICYFCCHTIK